MQDKSHMQIQLDSEAAQKEENPLLSTAISPENAEFDLANMKLGGGLSVHLLRGRLAGRAEKAHLIIRRLLSQEAQKNGLDFLDVGTDSFYPFFKNYTATTHALQALGEYAHTARRYPSSFGLLQLRKEIQKFFQYRFNIHVDLTKEIMITAGASQAFDALSRSFQGEYFLLPSLAISTIYSISIANGAKSIRVPCDPDSGLVNLDAAATLLERLGRPTVRFMYLNYPNNPTGVAATREFFEDAVAFARKFNVLLVHDMDTWYLTHDPKAISPNILEIPGAKDVAITILSLSKEFGVPGIRVGLVAGNAEVINALRIHNSEFSVMIPEPCQYSAIAALQHFQDDEERNRISQDITDTLHFTVGAWKSLGWPEEKIYLPSAGYKYLLAVPPSFTSAGGISRAELFDFYIAKRAYVKFSTTRAFGEENGNFIRVILMQEKQVMGEIFRRLRMIGLHYDMEMPPNLVDEYYATLDGMDLAHL